MANPNQVGAFIGTTSEFDVSAIYETDVTSPQFKELLVRLYQSVNNIALLLNIKDSGYYNTQEFVNGQLLFPNPTLSSATSTVPAFRQIFRTLVNFGQLPDAGILTAPHYINFTSTYSVTRIYGAASDPTGLNYIPLPYAASNINDGISLFVDSTNVNIRTTTDRRNFTICYVIIEYVKS